MHPEQIKAAIRMTGTTPAHIADGLGVSRNCVSHVIHSRGVSARVAKRISEVTGIPLATLWPGKYTQPASALRTKTSHTTGAKRQEVGHVI